MVEPRMLMVSSETGSRPRWVILTVRSAVFICGETEAMVPWRIVPGGREMLVACLMASGLPLRRTILEFNRDRLVCTFHQKSTRSSVS